MKQLWKVYPSTFLRTGCLLICALATSAQAEVGPALTGITARATDATTVFWSPAGITRLDKPELLVQTSLAIIESKLDVDNSNRLGGDSDTDLSILPVPGLYYVHPINDRWSAGASLSVPSGFGNDYGKDWSGRYLAESSELTFVTLTGTLGFEVTDQLSIGGGPMIMYTDSVSQARVQNLFGPDGKVELEEDGFGFGWQFGFLYDINDSASIGAVYRSEVDPDLSGKPDFSDVGPILEGALILTDLEDRNIDVDFKVPQQVQVGYLQELADDWSFTLDAIWLDTSEFGIQSVSINDLGVSLPAEFKDAWSFMLGVKHEYRPDLAFSVGAAYLTSPASKSKRSLALPLDRIIAVGAGVEWHWRGHEIHSSLNYLDLGDAKLENDVPLAGRVEGSFEKNHAIVLDMQIIKRF